MTCQQAAEVICRSVDVRPALGERVGIAVHTLFCGPCRRFRRQLLEMHVAGERALGAGVIAADGDLSPEARMRIVVSLRQMGPAGE
jgi:hypothetical protein